MRSVESVHIKVFWNDDNFETNGRGLTNCILLEQNNDVITGASAGNSGIFHTGYILF